MFKNVLVTFTVLVIFCLVKCNSLTQEIVIVNRIFGGYHVPTKDKFEFKWLVALHNRVNDNFFCAGSLISQQHVLTGEITKFIAEMMSLINFYFCSGPLLPAQGSTRKTFTSRISVQNWSL